MASLRSRLIYYMFRHRHLLQGRLQRPLIDWSSYEAILDFRRTVEEGAQRFGRLPKDITVESLNIAGVSAEWIAPPEAAQDLILLYFHGGGYVTGSCLAHRAIIAKFAMGAGLKTLSFEYRLAPEHPFPAALEDSLTVCNWLREQGISPSRLVLAGDSAGGGLCLATMLALKDQGLPLPLRAAVYSPVTDYTCSGESYRTNVRKCMAPEGSARAFARHYAGDQDPGHPYISPLFGDPSGLPPLLIYAAEDETLRDDAVRFANKARAAGVEVALRVGKDMFHCYPAMAPMFPEATRAMAEICAFLNPRHN